MPLMLGVGAQGLAVGTPLEGSPIQGKVLSPHWHNPSSAVCGKATALRWPLS